MKLPGTGFPVATSPELGAALEAAKLAAQVALSHLGDPDFELKKDRSLVTAADREAEARIREVLERATPGVPVVGEESARDEAVRALAAHERAWVVDPIDGTAAFATGLPTFGVSIGLLEKGEPVLGVLLLPRTDEVYACDRTGPATWGERAVRGVLMPETVDDRAFLCVSLEGHRRALQFPGKIRALGSTALHVALVARGVAVGALVRPKVWDVAAVLPILRRAGGDLFVLGTGAPLAFADWLRSGKRSSELLACSPESVKPLQQFMGK